MNRLLTGLGLLAVAFFLIFLAPDLVFVAAAITMSVLCYREFGGLVEAHAIPRPGWLGIVAGLSLLFWPQITQFLLNPIAAITSLLILMLVAALRLRNLREILPTTACEFLGAFYTFAPWRFSIDLRREGVHFLFFALALNWVGDTAAYYIGRKWGRHKLAPGISPGKSWQGSVASALAAVFFGLIYLRIFFPVAPWWKVAIVAFVGNVAGQLGDLAESAIKRGAGLKDSGSLLPGHGGILDRMDSSLFSLPIVFLLYLALVRPR